MLYTLSVYRCSFIPQTAMLYASKNVLLCALILFVCVRWCPAIMRSASLAELSFDYTGIQTLISALFQHKREQNTNTLAAVQKMMTEVDRTFGSANLFSGIDVSKLLPPYWNEVERLTR